MEAFLGTSVNEQMEPIVMVKYIVHDEPEWQPFQFMKDQLGKAAFDKFMEPLVTKPARPTAQNTQEEQVSLHRNSSLAI